MHIKCFAKCLAYGKFCYYSIGDSKGPSHQDEGYNFPKGKAVPSLELQLSKMFDCDSQLKNRLKINSPILTHEHVIN